MREGQSRGSIVRGLTVQDATDSDQQPVTREKNDAPHIHYHDSRLLAQCSTSTPPMSPLPPLHTLHTWGQIRITIAGMGLCR